MVELERPPGVVHDPGRVRNVPGLSLDVVVTAVDALAQPVVEAAEVAAALAVHPAEVLDLVPANDALGVGQLERPGPQPPPALIELQVVLHRGHRDTLVGQHDGALAGRLAAARVDEVKAAVIRHVEQHPLPDAGDPSRGAHRRGGIQPRTSAARLISPRVVTEEGVGGWVQLVAGVADPHPSFAFSGDLVRHALADQAAVDARYLGGILVRHRYAAAGYVQREAELVVLQHQPQQPHRLDDLEPQRAHRKLVHVRA